MDQFLRARMIPSCPGPGGCRQTHQGLNVLFAKTLKKMGLNITDMLTKSNSPFYGIVPSNAAVPLGQVVLPVTFGTKGNYRTEYIKFEVLTSRLPITPSSGVLLWPNSWLSRITCT